MTSNMDAISYVDCQYLVEYCTIKLCVARSRGRSGSRSGRSGGRWIEITSSAPTDKMAKTWSQEDHVRVREQDMFHQEHCEVERSRLNFDKFGRMRRKDSSPPFQLEGHRRFERRTVFLSRAGVKAPILKGLVGCFSGDTT